MDSNNLISKDNSLVLKGFGILLMLFHHLFFSPESSSLFWDYNINFGPVDISIVNQLGIYGKLCVAIFVFISGYGLESSYLNREIKVIDFYRHRFKKLYLNYWFIWIVFVPIGIFVFKYTFTEVYGDNNTLIKLLLDFFGILNLIGEYGYNPTWWFYSCIIILYLFFPLLHSNLSKRWLLIISIGVIVSRLAGIPIIMSFHRYLLPFIGGMLLARIPILKFDRLKVIDTIIAFILLSFIHNFSNNLVSVVETLICLTLAVILYKTRLSEWLRILFVQLGKHSQNIFLFHTFLIIWFKKAVYITYNPITIFVIFVVICYLISLILEYVKQKIGFYKLLK